MKTFLLAALACLSVSLSTGQTTYRKAIFLHHSVGDVIYHGSYDGTPQTTTVPLEVAKYNTAHALAGVNVVSMSEPSDNGACSECWPNSASHGQSENDWWTWQQIFAGQDDNSPTLASILAQYPVVVVKTCYLSEEFMLSSDSVEVYKSHYRAVVRYMSQHSNFFVIWNNYPAYYTGADNQLRSCQFSKWAKDTLATGKDAAFGAFPKNVYVFDVFRKLADPNTGAEPAQYIIGGGDEHPSNAAVAIVTPAFVKETFDAAIAYESGATAVVTTLAAGSITSSGAQLNGSVNPGGQSTTYHFDYGTTTSYGTSTSSQSAGSGTAAVSVNATVSGLAAATTYHFRLAATASGITVYGNDLTFTTAGGTAAPPSVTTGAASNVSTTGAQLAGTINPNGVSTTYHFEYGTSTSYGTSTAGQSAGSGTAAQSVNATLTGLVPGTAYHFRAAATSTGGTSYGSDGSFTTASTTVPPPTVTTGAAGDISTTGAQLNGTVNPNGVATTYHFEYGTSASYGTSTTAQSAGSGTTGQAVSAALTTLAPGTIYHYRLSATSTGGTVYGNDVVFATTSAAVAPLAATSGAGNVSATAAQLNGSVNPNGSATSFHFDYGTTTGYGTSTTAQSAGSGFASTAVSAAVTSLTPGTLYHFRVVAVSTGGTTNGRDTTFTTGIATTPLPTVVTTAAGNITNTSMEFFGSVNPNGSATSYHFDFGTTTDYGTSTPDQNAGAGSSAIAVSATVSSLTPGTLYHYRLVATNSGGTADGSDSMATTGGSVTAPPIVFTSPPGSVTTTAAQLSGTVNPNGVSTTFYFDYGPTPTYGSSTPSQTAGSGKSPVQVSATVTNLTQGSTYHYRLVASNIRGISDGVDSTFTTAMGMPREGVLLQNYPNPFNPTTTIRYGVPHKMLVTITVFNALGQPIAKLVDSQQDAGFHETQFDGSRLASGTYFYMLQMGDYMETRRIVLVH